MSRPVKEILLTKEFVAQVRGVFEHACNLVTPDGNVIALVVPQIGNGPFNIVVDDNPAFFAKMEAGMPVTLAKEQLQLGGWRVDLRDAAVWEPQPDWHGLRSGLAAIMSQLSLLRTMSQRHAPNNTFLALLEPPLSGDAVLFTAQQAGKSLQQGWAGDQEQLQMAVVGLAGLGSGLTPAGDDFLTGVMLWAWLAHPDPDSFCQSLLNGAASCTTTLSTAFLRAAARGECSASWHNLLAALNEGTDSEITATAQKVLAYGATSGADALAGFLYLPLMSPTLQFPHQPSPDIPSPR
jgi:hypothetical protein